VTGLDERFRTAIERRLGGPLDGEALDRVADAVHDRVVATEAGLPGNAPMTRPRPERTPGTGP
jgi:hypothetical protein